WKLSDRQVDNYIASATKRIIEAGKTKRETELGKAILRMEQIYFLSISLQNFQSAISAQREINKLLGLNMDEMILKRIETLEAGTERLSELNNEQKNRYNTETMKKIMYKKDKDEL